MNFNLYNSRYFWAGTAFGLVLAAGIYYFVLTSPLEAQAGEAPVLPKNRLPEGEGSIIEMEPVAKGAEVESGLAEGLISFFSVISTISRPGEIAPLKALPAGTSANPQPTQANSERIFEMPITQSLIAPKSPERIPEDFAHSEDFHSVYKDGKRHELTLNQSLVAERYYQGYLNGTPELNQQAVLVDLGINSRSIREVFKRNTLAFKSLFEQGTRKGTLRLRLATLS